MPDAQQHGDLLVRLMWTLSVSQAVKRNLKGGSSSLHHFVSEVIFIYVPIQLLILQLFLPDPVSGHCLGDGCSCIQMYLKPTPFPTQKLFLVQSMGVHFGEV